MSFQASSMVFVVLENGEANDDEDADEMDDEKPMWRLLVLLKLLSSSAAADRPNVFGDLDQILELSLIFFNI